MTQIKINQPHLHCSVISIFQRLHWITVARQAYFIIGECNLAFINCTFSMFFEFFDRINANHPALSGWLPGARKPILPCVYGVPAACAQ